MHDCAEKDAQVILEKSLRAGMAHKRRKVEQCDLWEVNEDEQLPLQRELIPEKALKSISYE